jgi:DNA-binding XRE family transcriptional regulator
MKSKKAAVPKKAKKTARKTKAANAKKKVLRPFGKRFPERTSASAAALAANLRRLRQEKELSQADVARATGVDQAAVALIELQRSNPTLRILDKIADFLGVTPAELLRGARGRSAADH